MAKKIMGWKTSKSNRKVDATKPAMAKKDTKLATKPTVKKESKPKRSKFAMSQDGQIKAKKPGWRTAANGNEYYEARPNRSDVNRKKKPYLKHGGPVEGVVKGEWYNIYDPGMDTWNEWEYIGYTPGYHTFREEAPMGNGTEIKLNDNDLKNHFEEKLIKNSYRKGGGVEDKPNFWKDFNGQEIDSLEFEGVVYIDGRNKVLIQDGEKIKPTLKQTKILQKEAFEGEFGYGDSSNYLFKDGGGVGESDILSLEGHWNSYNKGEMSGKQDEGYITIKNEKDLNDYIKTKIGNVVKDIKVIEKGKNYPYNRSNPYYEDTYLVTLKNGATFEVERSYGSPNWSGNVNYKEQIKINNISVKFAKGGGVEDVSFSPVAVEKANIEQLFEMAEEIGLKNYHNLNKEVLRKRILEYFKLNRFKGRMKEGGNTFAKEDKAMLHSQNKSVRHHSEEMENVIDKQRHIEPWVVAKMSRATNDMSDLTHYLDGNKKRRGGGVGDIDSNIHMAWDTNQKITDDIRSFIFDSYEAAGEELADDVIAAIEQGIELAKMDMR